VPPGTHGYPPRDELDRVQPRKINWFMFATSIPGLLAQFQDVPLAFWTQDDESEEGWPSYSVACPCGAKPPTVVAQHATECECGRIYLHLGKQMRVFRPEEVPAGVPER